LEQQLYWWRDIVTPYDIDGNPSSFSRRIRQHQHIWQRVAEDYAPFGGRDDEDRVEGCARLIPAT
jgi:hypothetical protein